MFPGKKQPGNISFFMALKLVFQTRENGLPKTPLVEVVEWIYVVFFGLDRFSEYDIFQIVSTD